MSLGSAQHRRGFTIVEVIVVVVIIAVLAMAIGPRLSAMGGDPTRASALAVGNLVSVAARRDALTSQQVAIEFDSKRDQLVLLTLNADPDDPSKAAQWGPDRLTPPVSLGDSRITAAQMDGVGLDADGWRVEFVQGSRRPGLVIVLGDAKGKEFWRVELPPTAMQAAVSRGNDLGLSDQSVDLDASGGGTSPW